MKNFTVLVLLAFLSTSIFAQNSTYTLSAATDSTFRVSKETIFPDSTIITETFAEMDSSTAYAFLVDKRIAADTRAVTRMNQSNELVDERNAIRKLINDSFSGKNFYQDSEQRFVGRFVGTWILISKATGSRIREVIEINDNARYSVDGGALNNMVFDSIMRIQLRNYFSPSNHLELTQTQEGIYEGISADGATKFKFFKK